MPIRNMSLIVVLGLMMICAVSVRSAAADSPTLSISVLHRSAEEAVIVRDLLGIESYLTYAGAAASPHLRVVARDIRARNQIISALSSAIITDELRASRAERDLHRIRAGVAQEATDSAGRAALLDVVDDAETNAKRKLEQIARKGESISIADMFEMQMLMNKLSQLSEMSTSIVSAANSAILSMARNVK